MLIWQGLGSYGDGCKVIAAYLPKGREDMIGRFEEPLITMEQSPICAAPKVPPEKSQFWRFYGLVLANFGDYQDVVHHERPCHKSIELPALRVYAHKLSMS